MNNLSSKLAGLQGFFLALAAIGAATALAITGHIPGTDAELIIVGVTTGATGVVAAHVGGNVATTAAGNVGPTAPGSPGPATVAGPTSGAGANSATVATGTPANA